MAVHFRDARLRGNREIPTSRRSREDAQKQGGSGGIGLKPDPRSVLQGPPASFNESAAMAARTRSGLAGSVSIQTPQASWIAAVIAGTTGIITISPIPRAPNGEIGSGDSMITDSISGTASTAVGTRLPSKP